MLFEYKGTEINIDTSLVDAVATIHRGECVLEHWDVIAKLQGLDRAHGSCTLLTSNDVELRVIPAFGICHNVLRSLSSTDVRSVFKTFSGYSGCCTYPLGEDEYDSLESANKFTNPQRKALLEHSLDVLRAFVKAYKEQYHV